jgi:hypothetical protein
MGPKWPCTGDMANEQWHTSTLKMRTLDNHLATLSTPGRRSDTGRRQLFKHQQPVSQGRLVLRLATLTGKQVQ